MPFCRKIRNCSGERIARHSSSDFGTDPEPAAMATTTPPRNLRLLCSKRSDPENPDDEMQRLTLLREDEEVIKRAVARVIGGEWIRLERTEEKVLEEQESGEVLRTFRPILCFDFRENIETGDFRFG